MLDIADRFGFAPGPCFQQLPQSRFSLPKRQIPKVFPLGEQQVERKENQFIGLAVGNRCLQRGKVRRAILIKRDDFAVDEHIPQPGCLFRDSAELVRPVQTFAGLQRDLAGIDTQLHAVAVEFDLMAPAFIARRPINQHAELRRNELRHRRDLLALWRGNGQQRGFLAWRRRFSAVAPVRMPHGVSLR